MPGQTAASRRAGEERWIIGALVTSASRSPQAPVADGLTTFELHQVPGPMVVTQHSAAVLKLRVGASGPVPPTEQDWRVRVHPRRVRAVPAQDNAGKDCAQPGVKTPFNHEFCESVELDDGTACCNSSSFSIWLTVLLLGARHFTDVAQVQDALPPARPGWSPIDRTPKNPPCHPRRVACEAGRIVSFLRQNRRQTALRTQGAQSLELGAQLFRPTTCR